MNGGLHSDTSTLVGRRINALFFRVLLYASDLVSTALEESTGTQLFTLVEPLFRHISM